MGEEDRDNISFTSADGESIPLTEAASLEFAQDVQDVRRIDLKEKQRTHRSSMQRQRFQPPKSPRVSREQQRRDTSYVKIYTREEIELENITKIREDNFRLYGSAILEHVVKFVQEWVVRDKSVKDTAYPQLIHCVLIVLTIGPVTVSELVKRLNGIIKKDIKEDDFRFKESHVTRMLSRWYGFKEEERWLKKYLIIDEGSTFKEHRFQFPPPMMKIAAEYPERLRYGMIGYAVQQQQFTEDMLLEELPILEKMVMPSKKDTDEEKEAKMLAALKDDFASIEKQMKDWWCSTDDIALIEIAIGFLCQGKYYGSGSLSKAMKAWFDKLHSAHPGLAKKIINVQNFIPTLKKWRENPEQHPLGRFIEDRGKSSRTMEYRIWPVLAKLPWRDIVSLRFKGSDSELDALCRKHKWLSGFIYLDNTEDVVEEPKDPADAEEPMALELTEPGLPKTTDILDSAKAAGIDIQQAFGIIPHLTRIFENGLNIHISFSPDEAIPDVPEEPSEGRTVEELQATVESLQLKIDQLTQGVDFLVQELTGDNKEEEDEK